MPKHCTYDYLKPCRFHSSIPFQVMVYSQRPIRKRMNLHTRRNNKKRKINNPTVAPLSHCSRSFIVLIPSFSSLFPLCSFFLFPHTRLFPIFCFKSLDLPVNEVESARVIRILDLNHPTTTIDITLYIGLSGQYIQTKNEKMYR